MQNENKSPDFFPDCPEYYKLPTRRFSAFALGAFFSFLLTGGAFLVANAGSAPTHDDVSITALKSTYSAFDSINSHCDEIRALSERNKAIVNQAAETIRGND